MHAFIIEARAFSFMLCISTCYVFVLCPTIMILSRLVYNPFLLSTLVKSNEHIHHTSLPTYPTNNRLWAQTSHHYLRRRNHHHLCSGVARSPRTIVKLLRLQVVPSSSQGRLSIPPSSSQVIICRRRKLKGDCPFLRRQVDSPSSR